MVGGRLSVTGESHHHSPTTAHRPPTTTVFRSLHWSRSETATPLKLVIFRLGLLAVGRWCRTLVRRLLQRKLITGRKECPIRLTRTFGKSEVIRDFEARREGGHGGSDTSIQDLVFRGKPDPDPLGLRADLRAGAYGSLIGIAAYRSIERGGVTVKIPDPVKL